MKPPSRSWAPATLSAALALVLYAVTLGGTYIYDDVVMIQLDDRVQHPNHWTQFWTHDWFNGAIDNLYRPLVSQSFGLEWWLHGDRPWVFHLVNILLNAGAAALVAELGRRLVDNRVGLIAGLLFACHPIHTEAVAGIVGRAELACAVGVLGSMVLFLKQPMTNPRAIAIGFLSALAMLSKEQGLLLPFLLAAMIPVRRALFPNPDPAERKPLQIMAALIVYFSAGLIVLREEVLKLKFEWDRGFLDIAMQPLVKSPPTDRWLIPIALLGRYFLLLVAPFKLSIDYGLSVINSTISRHDPYLWLGVVVAIGGLIALIVSLIRRKWIVFFCLIAMGLTYSMASNIVIIATIFGERLMYLPSAFFLILLAMLIVRLRPVPRNILVVVLLLLGCLRTWTYAARWNNRDEFYQYSLQQQPDSMKIALLVSYTDYEENRLDEASRIVEHAKTLYPDYYELWKRSALIAEKRGDWLTAESDWKHAFDLYPAAPISAQWSHAMEMARQQRAATQRSTTQP